MLQSNKTTKKNLPAEQVKSKQYDLFAHFVANDKSGFSNSIEAWESIPKYFFTARQVEKLRTDAGHADPVKWAYTYYDEVWTVKIQPALVEQKNGEFKAFFPSGTEELVEEALKKILANQNYGIHDPQKVETWVRFTLSMVEKELKERGRQRNLTQIKHAIEVMANSVITLYKNDKVFWTGSILQDLVIVDRGKYLADTNARHIVRLPVFISQAIEGLTYRQFNYNRLMECNEQLTRWIYRQCINRYRQADFTNSYHFMFSDIERNSGLLQQARSNDNRRKIEASLEELKDKNVFRDYKVDLRKEGQKIVDVKYTVMPSRQFVAEQKAANKRNSDSKMALRQRKM